MNGLQTVMLQLENCRRRKKDGYDCVVVTSNEDDNLTKMWLRKDIGMPVRVEQTTSEGPIVMSIRIIRLAQDDSLFGNSAGVDKQLCPFTKWGLDETRAGLKVIPSPAFCCTVLI